MIADNSNWAEIDSGKGSMGIRKSTANHIRAIDDQRNDRIKWRRDEAVEKYHSVEVPTRYATDSARPDFGTEV